MKVFCITLLCFVISITNANCSDAAKKADTEVASPRISCGPHEKRVRCKVPCHFDDCLSLYVQRKCIAPPKDEVDCVTGDCVCETGYLRWNGVCIPKEQCPPLECIHDPHAIRGCNERCGRTCDDYNTNRICKKSCRIGCDCKKGYVYDTINKICVLPKDCPPLCGLNEHYDPCGTSCPQASCDFPNPELCINKKCQPGCFCDEGYVRNPYNDCVLLEDCKDYICCDGGNQSYVPCTHRCPQNVCPLTDWPMACKPPRNCPGGCGCLPGYRWDENDECIHASDCPELTCTRPNTYWHPCSSPDLMEDCTNQQNQEDLPTPDICKPWCICEQGYFRDPSYDCVLPADCPP